jgi:hypothetical protein
MPAQLDRFRIPSQCDYYKAHSAPGFCCPVPMSVTGTPQCYTDIGGYWLASEPWADPLCMAESCCLA